MEYLIKDRNDLRNQYFLDLHSFTAKNYWASLGLFLTMLTRKDELENATIQRVIFLIGLQLENLELYDVAIEWYKKTDEQDAPFRLAKVCELKEDFLNAKYWYEQYLKQEFKMAIYGEYKSVYVPHAIDRLQQLTKAEYDYWQNYNHN